MDARIVTGVHFTVVLFKTRWFLKVSSVLILWPTMLFTCDNDKSSIPALATAVSDLPPRIGSGPWFVKSRPYRLSPSRIFCRH